MEYREGAFSETDPPSSDDMYAQDSIDLLSKSGIDFKKHEEYGIDVEHFGELLTSSGIVLLDDVKWISFHRYCFTFACSYLKTFDMDGQLNAVKPPLFLAATTLATSLKSSPVKPSPRRKAISSTFSGSTSRVYTTSNTL